MSDLLYFPLYKNEEHLSFTPHLAYCLSFFFKKYLYFSKNILSSLRLMRLYETIQQAYLEAFKAKAGVRKDILGYMFAQLKSKQIDLQKELTDDEVIQYIKKEIKNRQESITYATTAGKTDDAALDAEKIQILETFLPKQLSAEELTALIHSTITELGITDLQKQRGQLIGALMKTHSAQIDGKLLNDLIQNYIN